MVLVVVVLVVVVLVTVVTVIVLCRVYQGSATQNGQRAIMDTKKKICLEPQNIKSLI